MEIGPGSVLGGKYRLVRPLARGGQGSVWVAHHVGLDVPIAIKFLTDVGPETKKARSRFEREARAAASLRSPHVVQVLDYEAEGEVPFIVMELLEGEDLRKILTRRRRLPLGELSTIVTQLCKGLALAHDAGIIHRDLKPGNVFLARVGTDEIAKVLDFGVAKETALDVSQTDTTTGLVVGSPSYMSPEQARGGRVDGRSDLWSLAVMLFQAMTGKRPFDGTNLGDLLVHICSEPIPLPSHVAPDLPPAIDAFMVQALSRNPDQRFQNATDFARAFAEIAEREARFNAATSEDTTEEMAIAGDRKSMDRAASTMVDAKRPMPAHSPLEEPSAEEKSGTQATAAVDLRTGRTPGRAKRSSRGGPFLWIAGAAVVVVGGWLAWDSGLLRSGATSPASPAVTAATPATSAANSESAQAATSTRAPDTAPRESAAPAMIASSAVSSSAVSSNAVSSSAVSSSAPSASASAVGAQPIPPPYVPHGSWPPPHTHSNDPGPVDSKFGLPGGRH
jgi:serine/threonine protein kinase